MTIIVTCTCKISVINKLEMFARLDITCLVMYVFAEIQYNIGLCFKIYHVSFCSELSQVLSFRTSYKGT